MNDAPPPMNDGRAAAASGFGATRTAPSAADGRLMKRATMAAVVTAGILVVVKLVAWGLTDSMALLSTLIDSVLDVAASMVNLVAVRHSLQPADREHRFGHGKAEPLAGLGQAAFIAGSGLFLIIESAGRLVNPVPVGRGGLGIAVMVLSIVMTFALVLYQRSVIKRTHSVAISADSLHYTGDVMINGSVIISLVLGMTLGWNWLDPLSAVGIALYLEFNGWQILVSSLNLLMDREFPDEDRGRIKALCLAHPDVQSMHDLRTRSAGHSGFIQLHLVIDPDVTLIRAHDISDAVEAEIRAAFPNADVIIHQDPAGLPEEHPVFK